jgi:phosphohistidine phosphatase SixA
MLAERATALARESEAAITAREVTLATDAQRMLAKAGRSEAEFAGALAARQAEFAEVERY